MKKTFKEIKVKRPGELIKLLKGKKLFVFEKKLQMFIRVHKKDIIERLNNDFTPYPIKIVIQGDSVVL